MTRLTISVPDELAEYVEREAKRRGRSVSAFVREAILDKVASTERRRLQFIGLGRSGRRHTARDAEEILESEWTTRDRGR